MALLALRRSAATGLHLGAGSSRIEGLINCDLFDPAADRKIDATDLGDVKTGSVDLIEHHHMIEHLSFEQFDQAMKEWNRILRKGGYLVFTCPDIRRVCLRYLAISGMPWIRKRDEHLDYAIKMLVGSQEHEGMFHKNHFDAKRIRRILPGYGFSVDFTFSRYPNRRTPSLLVVAHKSKEI